MIFKCFKSRILVITLCVRGEFIKFDKDNPKIDLTIVGESPSIFTVNVFYVTIGYTNYCNNSIMYRGFNNIVLQLIK